MTVTLDLPDSTTTRTAAQRITWRHWAVVVGAGLLMAVAILMFLSASLMLPPLAESLGTGLGPVMLFVSINFVAASAVMALAGPTLVRRFGTRTLVIAGGAFSAAMVYAVSFVTSLTGLYALAFASGVAFNVATQMAATVLINDWFHQSRGFMMGLVMAIGGLGGIAAGTVLPPIVTAGGWQLGFQVAGVTIAAVTSAVGVLLIRSKPEHLGLRPYGTSTRREDATSSPAELPGPAAAVRTPQFAALALGSLGLNAILALQQHFAPLMAEHALDVTAAGSLISILALVNVGATLLVGVLGDRIGPLATYLFAMGLLVAALAVFNACSGYLPQLAAILLFSLSSVVAPVLTPLMLRRVVGNRAFTPLLGVGLATMPIGVALGSPLWGLAKDLTHSYSTALLIAMAVAAASAALIAYALTAGKKH